MEFTKKDLKVALIFLVINQLVATVIWFVFDANYFIPLLFGAIGGFYGGYYRNKKSTIQKQ